MFSHRISLVVALACLAVSANELVNPNLETDADGNLPGWKTYRPDNPVRVVHDDVQNGQSAIYGEISREKPSFGFMQTLVYDKPDNRPVTFGGWSKWDEAVRLLAGFDNMMVDTSSTFYALGRERSKALIRQWGADRVMFGTDYPMWDPAVEIGRFMKIPLSDTERRLILHDNAERILGIG